MKVTNREKDALKTSMTLQEFGKAMSALDLTSIPTEKRRAALLDHLARIMMSKIHDRSTAAELMTAYLMRRRNDQA